MPLYSHSRISSFEQCPLKYRYGYVDRLERRRAGIEAFMGSRFHEVMEHLYGRISYDVPALEELTALYARLWEQRWHDAVVVVQKGREPSDYRAVGLRAIEDYYRRYAPFDDGRVMGLEREITMRLDAEGRYRLRCIIDRLVGRADGTVEIHDYKTSGFLPTQEDVDGDRQLALYEMAVRQAWPDTARVELVWHYVAFDRELRSRRTAEQLATLARETMEVIDRIEAEREFAPHESHLCPWCDFQDICPLFADRFRTEGLPLEQYAEDRGIGLVNRYAALDAERRELSSRVKQIDEEQERLKPLAVEIAAAHGVMRLFGDTHALTIRGDIRVHYPKKEELVRAAFEDQMKGLGLWERVCDISWAAFRALAEREGWAEGAVPLPLAPYVAIERTHQMRLKRLRGKEEGE
jgi:putative RecB family exonuclease